MDPLLTQFEEPDILPPPKTRVLKKRPPSVSLGLDKPINSSSKKPQLHSCSEEQLAIHPNNDDEDIPLPEEDEETKH